MSNSGFRLQLVTPPAIEPVTLDDAKAHLRQALTRDDALITSLITAARLVCEGVQKQAYITQTYDVFFDYGSSPYGVQLVGGGYFNRAVRQMGLSPYWLPINALPIELPITPVQSVTSFKYVDTAGVLQTFDPADYIVSTGTPGRIQPVYGQSWPIPRPQIDAVQVRFVAGKGDTADTVPENVKAAMKLLIGHWYENRSAVVLGTISTTISLAVTTLLAATDSGCGYR